MKGIKRYFFIVILFIFIGGFLAIGAFKYESQWVFKEDIGIIIKGDAGNIKIINEKSFWDKGDYVALDVIMDNFETDLYYDEDDRVVTLTTLDKVIKFYGDSETVKINLKETDEIPPVVFMGERPYIPLKALQDYLKLDFEYIVDRDILILSSRYDDKVLGVIGRDNVKVFSGDSILSSMIDTLNRGDKVEIIREGKKWTEIIKDGTIGYVKTEHIQDREVIEGETKEIGKPIWKPEKGKIVLLWEQVHSRNPDTSSIGPLQGVNVVSPTWLSLGDPSGKINSKNVSKNYISWAKGRGYKVWVLFSNSFDPDLTHEFLKNPFAREKVIEELLRIIKENDIDGINIDFENVYLKDKEALVQFVRELTPVLHEENIVVSMDVTVKGGSENWSLFYDRKAIGEVVDYVAVMTYDEHWSSSPVSGSVASLNWVEKGILGLLEDVPEEKLLLGIPFYTRLWMETPSRKKANKMDVKSKTLNMEKANELMAREDAIVVWDEEAGQDYLIYIEDGTIYKVWVENSKSLKFKVDLANKYKLPGIAIWSRGFETPDVWKVIDETLNK